MASEAVGNLSSTSDPSIELEHLEQLLAAETVALQAQRDEFFRCAAKRDADRDASARRVEEAIRSVEEQKLRRRDLEEALKSTDGEVAVLQGELARLEGALARPLAGPPRDDPHSSVNLDADFWTRWANESCKALAAHCEILAEDPQIDATHKLDDCDRRMEAVAKTLTGLVHDTAAEKERCLCVERQQSEELDKLLEVLAQAEATSEQQKLLALDAARAAQHRSKVEARAEGLGLGLGLGLASESLQHEGGEGGGDAGRDSSTNGRLFRDCEHRRRQLLSSTMLDLASSRHDACAELIAYARCARHFCDERGQLQPPSSEFT